MKCPKWTSALDKIPSCVWLLIVIAVILLWVAERYYMRKGEAKKETFVVDNHMLGPFPDVFTMYKASWCKHCQKAEPEWDSAAKDVAKSGVNVVMNKVDVDESPEIVKAAGVKAFPTMTIKDGKTGKEEIYTGPRQAEALKTFVAEKAAEKTAVAPSM